MVQVVYGTPFGLTDIDQTWNQGLNGLLGSSGTSEAFGSSLAAGRTQGNQFVPSKAFLAARVPSDNASPAKSGSIVILAAHVVPGIPWIETGYSTPAWLSFAPFYVLVSSPCQEIVCRSIPKLMTDRLRTGGWAYVLYSAAVFSMIHIAYGDAALLVNTFLLGVVWGIAYLRMQNLWPLILSHAAVGTLAFSLGLA